ncbi:MAG: GNAT family N-acetyltransferase [Vicinamibacterales bacterium]
MLEIRDELPADIAAIREVNRQAFGQEQEGRLVDALRANGAALLSLVAVVDGSVVGHIFFSPLEVGAVSGAALAPMAVLPGYQRRGIGSRLVEGGLERLRVARCPFVVVVGHPAFYPRFGFELAAKYGLGCQWDVPEEAFMVAVLDKQIASGLNGQAVYRGEFASLE